MTNYDRAVRIYERGGQFAVYRAVLNGELLADYWTSCNPCEDVTPHEKQTCLVCGCHRGGPDQ
jgi:hypothetical protein